MAIVYRKNEKIKIKVDGIEIHVSPLSYHDKNRIQSLFVSGKVDSLMEGATLALKCAIKDVKGLTLPDGSEYGLEFDGGVITDECLDDLMNLECQSKLSAICISMIEGIPSEFKDPATKEVMEGVYIIKGDDKEKKK